MSNLGNYGTIPLRKVREQRRLALHHWRGLPSDHLERRAMLMVTYADLFQFCILLVALVGLCYTVFKGKK